MPWFGPCGTCGCDGGCTCQISDCNECLDPTTFEKIGDVTEFELTIAGFGAVYEYTPILGESVTIRVYGLDQFNGTYRFSAFHSFFEASLCDGGIFKRATVTVEVVDGDNYELDYVMEHRGSPYDTGVQSSAPGVFLYNNTEEITNPCTGLIRLAMGVNFDNFPIPDPCALSASRTQHIFKTGLVDGIFFQGISCGNLVNPITSGLVSIEKKIHFSNSTSIPLIGWNYTVSNVPSSFYLRISNGVKSYQITGMDVLNGDYELELDDESDCSKSGIEFLSFDITAQEFQISTSSPCTILPVGSTIAATARLALPPTSAGVVVTIRIPGENDKSILIDDWIPFGCEAYSDDAYIDHELTECFGNPDPILTLSKTAILD